MNSTHQPDPVFPLAGVLAERPALRAPRLVCGVKSSHAQAVMGNRAFIRAWAARRVKTAMPSPRAR